MKIRKMRREDLEAVARLEKEVFSDSWSEELLLDGMSRSWNRFLVAEEGTELLGYGMCCIVAGEGEIQRIVVGEMYQKRGLGRDLLDKLITISRLAGATEMTLEVREGNQAARKLYGSAGFQEEARRKDYYQNPKEDAIIMWNRKLAGQHAGITT